MVLWGMLRVDSSSTIVCSLACEENIENTMGPNCIICSEATPVVDEIASYYYQISKQYTHSDY